MENNKNKKSVKFQGDMLNFYDFIQVFVFTTNHHLMSAVLKANANQKERGNAVLQSIVIYTSAKGTHLF